MISKILFNVLIALLITTSVVKAQKPAILTVNADKTIAPIPSTLWGIFFEDINMAADGGIYAEMVKNRSFEFFQPLMGWHIQKLDSAAGSLLVSNRGEINPNNPRFAHVVFDNQGGTFGLTNYGFRGMGVKKDMIYHFSILIGQKAGNVKLRLELVSGEGKIIGTAALVPGTGDWQKYTADISAQQSDLKASLNIWFEGAGSLDMDMISLFPDDTWKHRPNGLRSDLVQLLADMKPGFIRFPGGCIVEGRELATRYQWKKTVGNPEDRQLIVNRWNTEFQHRPTPDYFQTFGLGFFEYFQLAEDIGAEPLPILSCGMACQFNTAEVVPMNMLDPYIQDALDLIEFANGPSSSAWGKLRTAMGHPAPFNLKMLGVGNEQWGPQYIERYKAFRDTLKKRYPNITLVTGTGPAPDGKLFDYAAGALKDLKAEIVDEHYYMSPQWFLDHANRYDQYDRNSYKIFAGEYAAQSVATTSPLNRNTWKCALSEAAFMTGLERNADVVYMSSYAPLFAHTDGWQWTPDLIWFNNLSSFGTANYYVQKLFSVYKGTDLLSIQQNKVALTGQNGLYATAVLDKKTSEIIVKLVNASENRLSESVYLQTKAKVLTSAKLTVLKSTHPEDVNSMDQPEMIFPRESTILLKGKTLDVSLDPMSLTVIRIPVK